VQGIVTPAQRGQDTIDQGIILVGRESDNGIVPPGKRMLLSESTGFYRAGLSCVESVSQKRDELIFSCYIPSSIDTHTKFSLTAAQGVTRPSWALDGSFFVFRYLKQLVPEFNNFLEANALEVPTPILPGDPSGADLLGARLVGRWKSGAPIDLTPLRDNPAMGANVAQNNAFRFNPSSQANCPFAAHIRKTNPRADLDAFGGTEAHRVLRRGIQFGPEVTPEEAAAKKSSTDPALERGLLFACYQSNIVNGFQFLQKAWANNAKFPPGKDKLTPPVPVPGMDPIIGQLPRNPTTPLPIRELVGSNPAAQTKELTLHQEWVISKGGEYFFSPSISALRDVFVRAADNC
jgi:Dyp-type peroxidase family